MAAGAGRTKKWFGYTVYFVLVTAVLLYYLFPTATFEEILGNSVSRINQQLVFKAGGIKPGFPAGLRITAGGIYLGAGEQPLFQADSLFIGPEILGLVRGEYNFNLRGMAYGGNIKGMGRLTDKGSDPVTGDIVFNDFLLDEYGFLAEKMKHRLTGRLSGEIAYNGESPGKPGGDARLEMNLNDGQLQFKEPLFNIASVDLQNIRLEAQLNRDEVTITKAELTGPEFNGTMTGSIQLNRDISRSQISLKGTLEPQAPFYQKYPDVRELLKTMKKRVRRGQYFFAVSGTLGNPKFELL